MESKSSLNPGNELYSSTSIVENLTIYKCWRIDAKDIMTTKKAIHFVLDLTTILAHSTGIHRKIQTTVQFHVQYVIEVKVWSLHQDEKIDN